MDIHIHRFFNDFHPFAEKEKPKATARIVLFLCLIMYEIPFFVSYKEKRRRLGNNRSYIKTG